LMRRPAASARTWEYVKANWDTVERTFGIFQGIPTVVEGTQHFCDLGVKQDVERFFSTKRIEGVQRTPLESIERCAALKSAQAANLSAFLAAADAR
jgi:hypothetical protein